MTKRLIFIAVAMLLMVRSGPAWAVIAAKTPPSTIYASSNAVVTGTVTKMNAEAGTIEASATALSGEFAAAAIKLKLVEMPQVLAGVKAGAPLVLCIGKRAASSALHLGDTWLFPEPV